MVTPRADRIGAMPAMLRIIAARDSPRTRVSDRNAVGASMPKIRSVGPTTFPANWLAEVMARAGEPGGRLGIDARVRDAVPAEQAHQP